MMTSFMMGLLSFSKLFLIIAWFMVQGSGFRVVVAASPQKRKPTSAPSGHLLPEEGGRMPPHRLPMKKAYDTRIPLSRIVISSESEKSFSFAVRQKT
ncbi:MAG: hypothetical protein SO159_06835 [Dialister sp.]|nr:hypothetical protein [Dialister sp.]MDD6958722.1 hypothetical protein [Dialister sp.]MDD7197877.1 hypothetical protein [Dialister sp.]MDY4074610.1 hypothetical protein [Dialister sp.]MDY4795687.1 hypothetical protein [Dialister sp.]